MFFDDYFARFLLLQAALVGLRISFRRMSTEVPKGELFTVMHRNSNSFHKLMELGKRSEKRAVIGHALKNARHITDAFCKLCIPIMDAGFARERVAICDVFKAFQMGTRLAQVTCVAS